MTANVNMWGLESKSASEIASYWECRFDSMSAWRLQYATGNLMASYLLQHSGVGLCVVLGVIDSEYDRDWVALCENA